MRLGIIGLPQSGKTTVFNALTRGNRPTTISGSRFEVQTAVVHVPDDRVDKLSAMFKPRKTIFAQVIYADIAGLEAEAAQAGFSGPLLNQLGTMDGYLHVVRAFENPLVPHPAGSVNVQRDLATVDGELMLNDMLAVERKLEHLNEESKKGVIKDKVLYTQELAVFAKLQAALTAEKPLRNVDLSPVEDKLLSSFGLLTRKPMLVVVNLADDQAEPALPDYPHARSAVVALRGKLEMDIAQLAPEEAVEFLKEYGIEEPSLHRMIRLSYDLLGLQSFFTVGEDEVRAWTVRRGASAPEAAGEVHTDLQKGFIRAEVYSYQDLMALGGPHELKAKGKLRLEGKEYIVQDGDVLNIRFSPPSK